VERVNLADAKTHLSEQVTRAAEGEEIEIMRRGKTVARLLPPDKPRASFDWDGLKHLTETMTPQTESAGEFMRKMRDSGY
jgi:prevent-host-death family protein